MQDEKQVALVAINDLSKDLRSARSALFIVSDGALILSGSFFLLFLFSILADPLSEAIYQTKWFYLGRIRYALPPLEKEVFLPSSSLFVDWALGISTLACLLSVYCYHEASRMRSLSLIVVAMAACGFLALATWGLWSSIPGIAKLDFQAIAIVTFTCFSVYFAAASLMSSAKLIHFQWTRVRTGSGRRISAMPWVRLVLDKPIKLVKAVSLGAIAAGLTLVYTPVSALGLLVGAHRQDGSVPDYFGPAVSLWRKAKQYVSPDIRSLCESTDFHPILYLRPFSDDVQLVTISHLFGYDMRASVRLEEAISSDISAVGSFIAIGNPRENLPELGAARAYFNDDEWRDAILWWIERAQMIITIPGNTEQYKWELAQIKQGNHLSKCVFVLPPEGPEDRMARVKAVFSELGDAGDRSIVEDDGYLSEAVCMIILPQRTILLTDTHQRFSYIQHSNDSHSETFHTLVDQASYQAAIRIATSLVGAREKSIVIQHETR